MSRHPNEIVAELDAAAGTLTFGHALRLSQEVGEYWMARAHAAEADADRLVEAITRTGFAAERVSMAVAMLQHDEAKAQR
jgi:hypothetical protein